MIIPNRMFLNANGAGFEEVTYDGGFGHLQKGHAVSFGDLDNDGDQDIYCVMGGSVEGDTYHNLLFENPGNDNAWIALELQGRKSNRKAIGARITISCKTRIGDMKNWYQTVGSGGSFGGSSLRLEVGLGEAVEINHVQVIWPYGEGIPEMFRGLEVSGTYLLVEGRGVPQILPRQSIEF